MGQAGALVPADPPKPTPPTVAGCFVFKLHK